MIPQGGIFEKNTALKTNYNRSSRSQLKNRFFVHKMCDKPKNYKILYYLKLLVAFISFLQF